MAEGHIRAAAPAPVSKAARTGKAAKGKTNATATVAHAGSRRTGARTFVEAPLSGVSRRTASIGRSDPLQVVLDAFAAEARRGGLTEQLDSLPDPAAFGAQLAAQASARATWESALGRYLSAAEAAKVLGVSSRQAVHQRVARGTLLAMDLAGQTVLPAYQFDGSTVRPEVVHVLRLLRPAHLSDEAVISWFGSPQPELEGVSPAEWLGKDPARLYEAARHTAGSLAH
jgi:hypothetical protein